MTVFFMELKNEATGLGWDDAKRTVVCSQEWWDEHVVRCQERTGKKCNHLKFKRQGRKHLEDLHVIFANVHVTGASASCAGDISSDESSDDNAVPLEKPDDRAEQDILLLLRGVRTIYRNFVSTGISSSSSPSTSREV